MLPEDLQWKQADEHSGDVSNRKQFKRKVKGSDTCVLTLLKEETCGWTTQFRPPARWRYWTRLTWTLVWPVLLPCRTVTCSLFLINLLIYFGFLPSLQFQLTKSGLSNIPLAHSMLGLFAFVVPESKSRAPSMVGKCSAPSAQCFSVWRVKEGRHSYIKTHSSDVPESSPYFHISL